MKSYQSAVHVATTIARERIHQQTRLRAARLKIKKLGAIIVPKGSAIEAQLFGEPDLDAVTINERDATAFYRLDTFPKRLRRMGLLPIRQGDHDFEEDGDDWRVGIDDLAAAVEGGSL